MKISVSTSALIRARNGMIDACAVLGEAKDKAFAAGGGAGYVELSLLQFSAQGALATINAALNRLAELGE